MIAALSLIAAIATAAAPEPTSAPRTWAIVVGVGELVDPALAGVPHGPADAERVRDHLTTAGGLAADQVLLLSDGGAPYLDPARPGLHVAPTRRNLRLAITTWLGARVGPGDLVIVSWSGQGAIGPAGEPLLIAADAAAADLVDTSLDASWLSDALTKLPATDIALWLDTSFAGRGAAATRGDASAKKVRFETIVSDKVTLWLATSTDRLAVEHGPHGAFTHALVTGLRDGRTPDDAWSKLTAALPPDAPRALRLGRADLSRLFAKRAPRERPELVLQSPHMGDIVSAVFDPTGRRLATTASDGTMKLWSTSTHRVVATMDTPGAGALASWSPDGERVLAHGPSGVAVWSAAGRALWSTPIDPGTWSARTEVMRDFMAALVRFSPDGRLVAIPHADRPTELRDAATGTVVATLPHGTSVGPLVWDPSGRRLAIPAANGTDVIVFAAPAKGRTWRREATLRGSSRVGNLVFSGDGKALVVGRIEPGRGGDFPPQVLTFHDASKRFVVRKAASPIKAELPIAASPDGRFVAAPVRDGIALVELATLTSITLGRTASGESAGGVVQFDRDTTSLAVYMADDTRLYTLDGQLVRTIAGEAIALAPDLSAALSGSSRNWGDNLQLKDLTGRHPPRPLEAKARPIIALDLRVVPGGVRLVSSEAAAHVVWDLASGRPTSEVVPPGLDRATTRSIDTAVRPGLAARYMAPRYPHGLCDIAPAGACATWDEVPAPGQNDVLLVDLAKGTTIGTLTGHRAPITGVVASPDGATIITASLDTTLRLWDVASARHLATIALLSPGADAEERWVIMTPDGLFDGSPSGQADMQWRVGDTLFRLEQYAGELFTPGLLARLWAGDRPTAGLVVADLQPPPKVTITSPTRGAMLDQGLAKVVVKVDDAGGGATPAWLYVNGRRVPTTRARPLGGLAQAFEVELVAGTNHLRATAFNRDGTVESAGDELTITWAVPESERPVLHVVAIGIDAYEDPSLRLSFAGADAKAISQAFAPGLFGRIARTTLLDREATRTNIVQAIAAVAKAAHPRDALLVYLAGHGALVGSTFYFLPWEARAASDDDVARTGLPQAELAEALMQVPAMKQVVVLDACHSGAGATALGRMIGSRDAVGLARAQRRLARASGVFLVAASTAAQKAGEIRELGHGILTYALLAGIGTAGMPPAARTTAEGHVTMNALLAWLDDEVPRLTTRHHGGPQNPVQASTGQDFPIVVVPR